MEATPGVLVVASTPKMTTRIKSGCRRDFDNVSNATRTTRIRNLPPPRRKLNVSDLELVEQHALFDPSSDVRFLLADECRDFTVHKSSRKRDCDPNSMTRKCAVKQTPLLLLLLTLALTSPAAQAFRAAKYLSDSGGAAICEPIEIKLCKDVGYNYTNLRYSPSNILQQSEASLRANQFISLIRSNCDPDLKLLVCSVYAPICFPRGQYNKFFPPCRFVCERVRKNCLPLILKYDPKANWPELFDCDNFPAYSESNKMCLHVTTPDDATKDRVSTTSRPSTLSRIVATQAKVEKVDMRPSRNSCQCSCVPPMVPITDPTSSLYNKVSTGGVLNCAMSCHSPYFSEEKRRLAESWITAWSVVCFAVTLVTVSTFLIDTERFKYPERPVIFLSACYMFVSIGFLIRVVAGHEAVACSWNADHVLYKTTGPFLCSAVFLLIYFFGMAGALWWVVLSLTWFLAAGFKCCSESIADYSHYFHAACWLVPTLKSITLLAMSSVDGDALAGICYVGNQDARSLRGFVAVPLLVYLSLGGLFLFFGFLNMFRIRNTFQKEGKQTDSLEKLMGRIGLFSLLYMIPSAALVACYFYQLHNAERWAEAYNCGSNANANCPYAAPEPEFAVFIVKYSMMLLIGVTNGVWICSGKTFTSWRQFYVRCCTCLRVPPGGKKAADKAKEPASSDDHQHSDTSFMASSNESGRADEGTPLRVLDCGEAANDATGSGKIRHTTRQKSRERSHSSATPSDATAAGESRTSQEGVIALSHSDDATPTDLELCTVTSPMTCHALGGLGVSCQLCNQLRPGLQGGGSATTTNPWFVLCDQSGNPLIDDRDLGTTFFEADASGRIQHIHHHHHHHVSPDCKCACHKPHKSSKHSARERRLRS